MKSVVATLAFVLIFSAVSGTAYAQQTDVFGSIYYFVNGLADSFGSIFSHEASQAGVSQDTGIPLAAENEGTSAETAEPPAAFNYGYSAPAELVEIEEADFTPEEEGFIDSNILTPPVSVHLETGSFFSKSLDEEKKYSVLLPPSYYKSARSYPVVYLLNGLWGDHTDWIVKGNVIETYKIMIGHGLIGEMIIAMPDGDNSAYENGCSGSVVFSCGDYEDYVINDFVQEIDGKYRTIPDRSRRAIGGLSLGARGAMRLAFFHPDIFSSVAGHSGRYSYLIDEMTGADWQKIKDANLDIYFDHSKNDLVPGYLSSSRKLDSILTEKGIRHEYREIDFSTLKSHDWPFWKEQIRVALVKECTIICTA